MKQNIFWFQVSVYDVLVNECLHAIQNLTQLFYNFLKPNSLLLLR
jgi:hypothetical protein